MSIHAPYNFVPLSKFIFLPDWAYQVSHDLPFSDGVSGTLSLQLKCHTHTLVGGKTIPATDDEPSKVEFFKTPDGQPTIPGTSIKGMLSNVLEIASFSRFNRLDDKRHSVRDLSASGGFYLDQFKTSSQTGWLTFNQQEGCWQITPCKMARIHQQDIIDYFLGKEKSSWVKDENKQAHERYKLLGGLRELSFDIGRAQYKGVIAKPNHSGEFKDGVLVVTGQPSKAFDVEGRDRRGNVVNKNKKWEFVFYAREEKAIKVSTAVMRDFVFIHDKSKEWKYWQEQRRANNNIEIPVFYQTENNGTEITSLGLSFLYRLAYKYTTHDAVKHTQVSHIDATALDLPALIFGQSSNTPGQSLRGRVQVGCATLCGEAKYNKSQPPTILAAPKPSYYPAYIRQPDAKKNGELENAAQYQTLMDESELAGWKRYPAKGSVVVMKLNDDNKNYKVQVKLEPIEEQACFDFNISFHNLREAELGALLWSLDFGDEVDCFHSLGMGKPFGMGRVSIRLKEAKVSTAQASQLQNNTLLDKARASFIQLMNDAYHQVAPHSWHDSPQIQELLAMAKLTSNSNQPYMELTGYTDSKGNKPKPCVLQTYTQALFDHDLSIHVSSSAEVNSNLSMLSNVDYLDRLKTQRDKEKDEKRVAELINKLENELQHAVKETRRFIEFEMAMIMFSAKPSSKTRKKRLVAMMRKAFTANVIQGLDEPQRQRGREALTSIRELEEFTDKQLLDRSQRILDNVGD